jgi:hypothetical protein
MRYLKNNLNAWTQALGALLGATFNSNESLSGAMYRRRNERKRYMLAYIWINRLFFWQENHCRSAAEAEIRACENLIAVHLESER